MMTKVLADFQICINLTLVKKILNTRNLTDYKEFNLSL